MHPLTWQLRQSARCCHWAEARSGKSKQLWRRAWRGMARCWTIEYLNIHLVNEKIIFLPRNVLLWHAPRQYLRGRNDLVSKLNLMDRKILSKKKAVTFLDSRLKDVWSLQDSKISFNSWTSFISFVWSLALTVWIQRWACGWSSVRAWRRRCRTYLRSRGCSKSRARMFLRVMRNSNEGKANGKVARELLHKRVLGSD